MIDLRIDGGVAHIVLDSPAKLNALDEDALRRAGCRLRRGRGIRCPRPRAARRGSRVLRRTRHRRRRPSRRRRHRLPRRARHPAAAAHVGVPRPDVRRRARRVPRRRPRAADRDRCRLRRRRREDRLAFRRARRDARLRRPCAVLRASGRAPHPRPHLHGTPDVGIRGGRGGPVLARLRGRRGARRPRSTPPSAPHTVPRRRSSPARS